MTSDIDRLSPVLLVVDDQLLVGKVIEDLLSTLGYQVILAENAADAIQLADFHREEIDLLLTDIEMPGMDGISLARFLKDQRPDMKIIYMSGNLNMLWQHESKFIKGSFKLEKPLSCDLLRSTISGLLSRKAVS